MEYNIEHNVHTVNPLKNGDNKFPIKYIGTKHIIYGEVSNKNVSNVSKPIHGYLRIIGKWTKL